MDWRIDWLLVFPTLYFLCLFIALVYRNFHIGYEIEASEEKASRKAREVQVRVVIYNRLRRGKL